MNKNNKGYLEVGATYQYAGSLWTCEKIDREKGTVWFEISGGNAFYGRDSTGFYPFSLSGSEADLRSGRLVPVVEPKSSLWSKIISKLKTILKTWKKCI